MGYYMGELYRRYFRATGFNELEKEIENSSREVRDCLNQAQRRKLMYLVDAQNLLREEIAQASFAAGFRLAWGLIKELETEREVDTHE